MCGIFRYPKILKDFEHGTSYGEVSPIGTQSRPTCQITAIFKLTN